MSTRLVVSDGIVAGNPYDKYGTRNPVARRLVAGFLRGLDQLLHQCTGVRRVIELGCGEGQITERLARRFPKASVLGTDVSTEILHVARERHPDLVFERLSAYDLGSREERWDLSVACEVFEHLERPDEALEAMRRSTDRWMLITVPREPLWRVLNVARGCRLFRRHAYQALRSGIANSPQTILCEAIS